MCFSHYHILTEDIFFPSMICHGCNGYMWEYPSLSVLLSDQKKIREQEKKK